MKNIMLKIINRGQSHDTNRGHINRGQSQYTGSDPYGESRTGVSSRRLALIPLLKEDTGMGTSRHRLALIPVLKKVTGIGTRGQQPSFGSDPGVQTRPPVWRACIYAMLLLFTSSQLSYAAESITYIHNDALGSPIAATNINGNVMWKENYEPYGKELLKASGGTANLLFTGKMKEDDHGITYFGARWYDDSIGRFLSKDPVEFSEGNIHSFNRYAYANNNPYRFIDPDGRWALAALSNYGESIGSAAFYWKSVAAGNEIGMRVGEYGTQLSVRNETQAIIDNPENLLLGKFKAVRVAPKVLIGEGQLRVNKFAADNANKGYTTITDWLNGRKWTQELNDQFISGMKKKGASFHDLGPQFSRREQLVKEGIGGNSHKYFWKDGSSKAYNKERRDLKDYGGEYHKEFSRK